MKKIASVVFASLLALTVFAQAPEGEARKEQKPERKEWSERMQAEKVAFYTRYVGLTAEEAEAFWPVFNEAEAEQRNLAKATRDAYKALSLAVAGKTEGADVEALTKAYVATLGKSIDNEKYLKLYSKILPAEKVAKIFLAEERFRRQQIQRLSEGGSGHQDGRGLQEGRGPREGFGPQGDRNSDRGSDRQNW